MIRSAIKEIVSLSTESGHASCIARVNGETWLTWFGGTHEKHPDVDIFFSRRTLSGWTEPLRISAGSDIPHWNPVLEPLPDGAYLYFKIGHTIPEWRTLRARLSLSGEVVEPPEELVPGDVGGRGPVRNKCLTLRNGLTLAPASIEHIKPHTWREYPNPAALASLPGEDPALRWRPFVDISEDGGKTFSRLSPVPLLAVPEPEADPPAPDIPAGSALPAEPCRVRRAGAIQPALWQSEDGSVHMLMRSSEGCILRSDSPDGLTWSAASVTGLPNNNSGIDLTRLDDGRILLCLNPVPGDWAARTPLWLWLSQDGGDSFSPLMALEISPGEYSYPSLACEGNTVYLSYTWNRKAVAVWQIGLEPANT